MFRAFVLLAALLAVASAQPYAGKWVRTLTNGPYYPQGRYFHSGVSAGNNAVIFGGVKGSLFFSDLFVYQIEQAACHLLDNGNGPAARAGACSLTLPEVIDYEYDTNGIVISETVTRNQSVLIFGGYDSTNYYSDIWMYDLASGVWKQEQFDNGPAGRAFHTCTTEGEPGAEVLSIFGGKSGDNTYLGVDDFVYYNVSTSSWGTWENNSPAGVAPSNRAFIQGIHQGEGMEIFGGYDGNDCLADTWIFRSMDQSWFSIPTAHSPPALAAYAGVQMLGGGYDTFGGFADCKYTTDQLYGLSHSAPDWRNLPPAGIAPPARAGSIVTRHGQDMLLFGGADGYFANGTLTVTTVFDDLWYFIV